MAGSDLYAGSDLTSSSSGYADPIISPISYTIISFALTKGYIKSWQEWFHCNSQGQASAAVLELAYLCRFPCWIFCKDKDGVKTLDVNQKWVSLEQSSQPLSVVLKPSCRIGFIRLCYQERTLRSPQDPLVQPINLVQCVYDVPCCASKLIPRVWLLPQHKPPTLGLSPRAFILWKYQEPSIARFKQFFGQIRTNPHHWWCQNREFYILKERQPFEFFILTPRLEWVPLTCEEIGLRVLLTPSGGVTYVLRSVDGKFSKCGCSVGDDFGIPYIKIDNHIFMLIPDF